MNAPGDRLWWVNQYDRLALSEPQWKKFKSVWIHARRTYVTAEVGASWIEPIGNALTGEPLPPLERAKVFVEYAKSGGHHDPDYGASAVKFQYWSNSQKLAAKRRMPKYAERYERSRLPAEWLPILSALAKQRQMDFLCTTYVLEDIPIVAPYVSAFKVASFEVMDFAFLEAHLPYKKPIFLSVGLTTADELKKILAFRAKVGFDRLKLLHCVSAYPCPLDQVNLSVIRQYDLDGFSDHTGCPIMGALAVLAGAKMIEVHIRSEFGMDNPDYPHSLPPDDYQTYLDNILIAEAVIGKKKKITQPAEADNRQYMARRE